jgi:nucleoside-diphosphate-sugar epimerase
VTSGRVLVTGATGFIGRHAIGELAGRGFDVHCVARAGQPDDGDGRWDAADWHAADLLEPDAAELLVDSVRPTHLLHLAWYVEHGSLWTSPLNVDWVEASLRLLRAFAAAGGQRAVLAGTCAEYDWSYGVFSEELTPLAPTTQYGRSKHALHAEAEQLAARTGVSLAWGRIFFVYGPHEHPDRLAPALIRPLLQGRRAAVSEGSQVRDYLHAADVAGAFAALVGSSVNGAVNVGSGTPISVRDFAHAVGSAMGRSELIDYGALPRREGDPPVIVADSRRLREEVGWSPRFDLTDGLHEVIDWWRSRELPDADRPATAL